MVFLKGISVYSTADAVNVPYVLRVKSKLLKHLYKCLHIPMPLGSFLALSSLRFSRTSTLGTLNAFQPLEFTTLFLPSWQKRVLFLLPLSRFLSSSYDLLLLILWNICLSVLFSEKIQSTPLALLRVGLQERLMMVMSEIRARDNVQKALKNRVQVNSRRTFPVV